MGRLAEMLAGKGGVHTVHLKRADMDVGIIPVMGDGLLDSQEAALEVCRKRKVDVTTQVGAGIYQTELSYQMICRFLVDPENPSELLCANVKEARQFLNPWEADWLADQFAASQAQANPPLGSLSKEEIDELGEVPPSDSSSRGDTPTGSKPSSAFQRMS